MNLNSEKRRFRSDIQGLRAVAVVLVILNHVLHVPSGGFVGVDVFYVISGFLITGLLLRELDSTGSVSLRAFYARRVRRIVPVALLVVAVTVLTAFVFWYLPRALQVTLDALSASLFVSNWHFMSIGTDYLQADGPVSPLQHYWSLSIEEQFYAVWPLLLLLLTATMKSRRSLAVVVLAAVFASAGLSAWLTTADPIPAYFNTFARCWELLAGALLATFATRTPRLSSRFRTLLSGVGLMIIVASAMVIGEDWTVPFPWVGPAVVGSMLVIWAAAPAGKRSFLGNPVSQWLGNISYSLYLWHFPVLVFGQSLLGDALWSNLLLVGVMLGLSQLSYRYVELAVMNGRFLRRVSRTKNERRFVPSDILVGCTALAAILVLAASQLHGPDSLRSASSFASKFFDHQPYSASQAPEDSATRVSEVIAAVNSAQWPVPVSEELTWLDARKQPLAMRPTAPGCRNSTMSTGPTLVCELASGESGRALLLGDSVALSWAPTVAFVAKEMDWTLKAAGFTNCSLVDVRARNNADTPGFAEACSERRERMFDLIAAERPDSVFISASETVMGYMDLPLDDAAREWQAGLSRTLERLREVPHVYVVSNPPLTEDPLECANKLIGPSSCLSPLSEASTKKVDAELAAIASHPNAQLVNTTGWFCSEGQCPVFVGEHVLKTDTAHLTAVSGEVLGPLLLQELR